MFSITINADSMLELGKKLIHSGNFIVAGASAAETQTEMVFPAPTNLASPTNLEPQSQSQAGVGSAVDSTKPRRGRKPKSAAVPPTTSVEASSDSNTPVAETSTAPDASAEVTLTPSENLIKTLNALLEHPNGGIAQAREVLGKFGASKVSEIKAEQIDAVIAALKSKMAV